MSLRTVNRIDNLLLLTGLAVLLALGLRWWAPWHPRLVVWSCGSNYESLSDYAARFEQRHNCRVRYVAAPVQYLLELAMTAQQPPDVIVGRGGPGWEALRQEGKLADGPHFFAVDPYVIVTAPGNPKGIKGLEDLGREGVRTTYAPWAMRPRGKCQGHLMAVVSDKFFPGLVERWENNATAVQKCGRKLVDPVVQGRADAVIVPRCSTTWPELRGRIEVVPIAPKYMLAMKQCRANAPQCCGVLSGARHPDLARRFVGGMMSDLGKEVFEKHGYFHITSPQAKPYEPLLQVFKPKDMAGWQVHLAQRLRDDGALPSALRRYLIVANIFGPSHYDARSRYEAARCAEDLGLTNLAAEGYRRVVKEFPRKGKREWESEVLQVGKPVPNVTREPEEVWVNRAQDALQRLAPGTGNPDHRKWMAAFPLSRIRVREGDPSKNGTRWFANGQDLMALGQYESATRGLLKVVSLNYPSKHMPAAWFRVGVCDVLRGHHDVAQATWQQLRSQSAGTAWAARAEQALAMLPGGSTENAALLVPMPRWTPKYDTQQERCMTYGWFLWQHRLPLFNFKEMIKLLCGIYGPPGKWAAEARFRAGVCCLALGHPGAAIREWRMVEQYYPQSPWSVRARQARNKLATAKWPPKIQKAVHGALCEPVWERFKLGKSSPQKRMNGAEEFFRAKIFEGDQALLEYHKVMSVTDPSGRKNAKLKPKAELRAGQCLMKMGRPEAARKHFEIVLTQYADSPAARKAKELLDGLPRASAEHQQGGAQT